MNTVLEERGERADTWNKAGIYTIQRDTPHKYLYPTFNPAYRERLVDWLASEQPNRTGRMTPCLTWPDGDMPQCREKQHTVETAAIKTVRATSGAVWVPATYLNSCTTSDAALTHRWRRSRGLHLRSGVRWYSVQSAATVPQPPPRSRTATAQREEST